MNGWIKISRELPKHWIWQDADRLKWWLDLLFMASWEDSKQLVGSRLIEIKRGQLVASISYLVKRWGIGHNSVISFLKMLQEEKMITKSSMRNISIITICNYEKHQAADNLSDKLNGEILEQCAQTTSIIADNLADSLADNIADSPADTNKEIKNIRNIIDKKQTKSDDEDFSELETVFEDFRKVYPGMKRGHKTEFENFKKKYPKTWREIIPLLLPAIKREIKYHEDAKAAGQFVPSYKHLQTWINQTGWDTEFPTIAYQQTIEPQKTTPAAPDYSDNDFGGADY